MPADEVVITGVGVVSPVGVGRDAYWAALAEGRSGVTRLSLFDPSGLPVQFAGQVADFDAKAYVSPRKSMKVMSRDIQLSYVAAKLASRDAALEPEACDPHRVGVVYGADMMYCELIELEEVYRACIIDGVYTRGLWGEMSMRELFPLWMLKYLPNMPACHIAIAHDARGPCNSHTLGEVSSLLAIAEGVRVIQRGQADAMIVGGGSCPLHPTPMVYRGDALLSRRHDNPSAASRPFDAQRDGMVRGEGSAAFVIERRAHAKARGAKPLARILGYASVFEPRAAGAPLTGSGIRRAIRGALADAELPADQVGHVNANGLSTVAHDALEAQAIRAELGDTPVTAMKSFVGNLGAGAGAVELAATVIGLSQQAIPYTLNYEQPDPECPVNVVAGNMQTPQHNTALKLSFTTLGQAVAVVLAGE